MIRNPISRRSFLGLGAGAGAAAALAACGSSGPGSGNGGDAAGAAPPTGSSAASRSEAIREATIERFNKANPDGQITGPTFQNDAYKTKIKTAIGAGQGPTIIWGWGGGGLRELRDGRPGRGPHVVVRAERRASRTAVPVLVRGRDRRRQDLRDAGRDRAADRPVLRTRRSSTRSASSPAVLGRHHGPGAEVQREGHRAVLARRPVPLDEHDVAGVPASTASAAARSSRTCSTARRTPGPTPPPSTCSTKMQDLVKANGFIKGFSSITADSNADQALLYTGKAAMMLHGAWTYGIHEDRRRRLRLQRRTSAT